MSQHAVERTVGKLATDEEFRPRLFEDPGAATWEAPPGTDEARSEQWAVRRWRGERAMSVDAMIQHAGSVLFLPELNPIAAGQAAATGMALYRATVLSFDEVAVEAPRVQAP
jgi:hypothetical protein